MFLSTPSRDTKVGNRTMTPAEYQRYVDQSGQAIYRRLSLMAARLQGMTRERVEKEVERITREERDRVKAMIARRPNLELFGTK